MISAAVSRCLKHCPRLPPLQAGNQGLCFSPDSRGLLFVAPVSCWPQRRRAERSRVGPTESQGPGGLHALSPDEPLEAEISDCHPAVMQSPTRASKITDEVLLCSGVRYDDVTSHPCRTDRSLLRKCARCSWCAGSLAPSLFPALRLQELVSERTLAILRRRCKGLYPRDHASQTRPLLKGVTSG